MEWMLLKVGEGVSYVCQLLAGQSQVFVVGVMVGGVIIATGHKKLGILATTGNISTNLYQNMCKKYDIDYLVLDENRQANIMSIIYDDIKSGNPANMNKFNDIVNNLKENNCDGAILGCTELSILKNDN